MAGRAAEIQGIRLPRVGQEHFISMMPDPPPLSAPLLRALERHGTLITESAALAGQRPYRPAVSRRISTVSFSS